jgi:predicted PurR-regulated permease PerM
VCQAIQVTGRSNPERIVLLSASLLLAACFIRYEWPLLLLAFAGFLISVLLHAAAAWVEQRTPLNPLLSYLATLLVIAAAGAVAGLLLAPRVITQLSQVIATLPLSAHTAESYLRATRWGAALLSLLPAARQFFRAQFTNAAKAIFQGGADLVVILVVGFFGALNPKRYREGLLSLVPSTYRDRARTISNRAIRTLRSWLLGQMIPMAVLGLASMIALWSLKVPLAFTVGLLTGMMVFVPYIGSVASGLVAILLALESGPSKALSVFIAYCIFHVLEGYILTPLVQRRAVRLPPVLTILAQLFFWSFGGVLGVAVAAPLAAVGLDVLKTVYLKPDLREQKAGAPA